MKQTNTESTAPFDQAAVGVLADSGSYRWTILAVAFTILLMAAGIGMHTLPVFLLPLENYFHTSRTLLSTFSGMLFLVTGVASPLMGYLIHRYSTRQVMMAGALLTGLGFFLISLSAQVWQLFVFGLPLAFSIVAISHLPNQTLVMQWFTRQRGRAVGILLMAPAIGGMIFAPLAHYLLEFLSWQQVYAFFALFIVGIVFPVAYFFVRDNPQSQSPPNSQAAANDSGLSSMREVIGSRSLWLIFIAQLCIFTALGVTNTQIVAIVVASGYGQILGEQTAEFVGSQTIAAYLVMSVLGGLLSGFYSEKLKIKMILTVNLTGMLMGCLFLYKLQNIYTLAAFAVCYGLGMGGGMVVLSLFIIETFGITLFSRVMGVMTVAITLGMGIGPVIGGLIYDGTGSYQWAFAMMGILFLCAMVAVGNVKSVKK